MVRAKMVVISVHDIEMGGVLKMDCIYDPEIKAEDRSFMEATPWGHLEMGIDSQTRHGRRSGPDCEIQKFIHYDRSAVYLDCICGGFFGFTLNSKTYPNPP